MYKIQKFVNRSTTIVLIVVLILPLIGNSQKYEKLTKHNIEPYISVSGLSGGGSFAMMLSFIFSSFIKGVGLFAGAPMGTGLILVENPINFFNFTRYQAWIDYLSQRGYIDDVKHLQSNRAYVFHGSADQIVPQFLSRINVRLYKHYRMRSVKDMVGIVPASHCFPTSDKGDHPLYTNHRICSIGYYFAICACGYSGVNHMASVLYPDSYVEPNRSIGSGTYGRLFKFDQDEFFPTGNASIGGFFEHGYAYVPHQCMPKTGIKCKLHFAFHGCGQQLLALILRKMPEIVTEVGYLEMADANNMIVIFPITFVDYSGSTTNYIGCFDLYSHTSWMKITFSTKFGLQPQAVKKMYERILHGV